MWGSAKKRADNVRPYIFQKSLVLFDNLCYSKYTRQIKAGRGVSSPPRPCAGARPPTQQHCCTGTHYTRHPCLFQAQILVYEFLVVRYVMRVGYSASLYLSRRDPCGGISLSACLKPSFPPPAGSTVETTARQPAAAVSRGRPRPRIPQIKGLPRRGKPQSVEARHPAGFPYSSRISWVISMNRWPKWDRYRLFR